MAKKSPTSPGMPSSGGQAGPQNFQMGGLQGMPAPGQVGLGFQHPPGAGNNSRILDMPQAAPGSVPGQPSGAPSGFPSQGGMPMNGKGRAGPPMQQPSGGYAPMSQSQSQMQMQAGAGRAPGAPGGGGKKSGGAPPMQQHSQSGSAAAVGGAPGQRPAVAPSQLAALTAMMRR